LLRILINIVTITGDTVYYVMACHQRARTRDDSASWTFRILCKWPIVLAYFSTSLLKRALLV